MKAKSELCPPSSLNTSGGLRDVVHIGVVGRNVAVEPLARDVAPHDVDRAEVEEQARIYFRVRLTEEV